MKILIEIFNTFKDAFTVVITFMLGIILFLVPEEIIESWKIVCYITFFFGMINSLMIFFVSILKIAVTFTENKTK